jgi:hypothetical protein
MCQAAQWKFGSEGQQLRTRPRSQTPVWDRTGFIVVQAGIESQGDAGLLTIFQGLAGWLLGRDHQNLPAVHRAPYARPGAETDAQRGRATIAPRCASSSQRLDGAWSPTPPQRTTDGSPQLETSCRFSVPRSEQGGQASPHLAMLESVVGSRLSVVSKAAKPRIFGQVGLTLPSTFGEKI